MKRTMNRMLARLAMLCIAVILGAIAVAQAQRGMQQTTQGEAAPITTVSSTNSHNSEFQPIPAPIPNDSPGYQPEHAPLAGIATAAPLPEPELSPPPVEPYNPQPPAPQAMASDYPVPNGGGGYYEPDYGAPTDAYEPSPPPPARTSQVITAANEATSNDSEFVLAAEPPQDGGAFTREPAAELTPINQLPLDQPPVSQPPVHQLPEPQFAADPVPITGQSSFPVEPQPTNDDYSGRARLAIQDTAPQQFESSLPSRNDFADSTKALTDEMRGIGRPGPSTMEGTQTPSLTVVKSAPQETQVGKPARFQIVVRNTGNIPANDVMIRDEVPQGTTLIETDPPANRSVDGAVLWQLGSLDPGREARVEMEVMPQQEGEIGSVAIVSFQTSASARTMSTRPQLVLEHEGPPEVLVGQDVLFNIKITNPGTGVAYNVRLEEDVPEGLRHFDGRELEYKIGDLKPGETRLLELKLKADKPGIVSNLLYARADAGLEVTDDYQFEVVAPLLQIGVDGPRRRYLERRAAFEISVANPGTAPAQDVQLLARLPRGLRFVDTNNSGHYDSKTHSVRWSLEELPAKEMGTVELATMPTTMGEQRIRIETTASMGLKASTEHDMVVEGLAALLFTVTDVSDPIEIGGETTYEIHVVNQGTKPATNLRLQAVLPPGMEAVNGEGPARVSVQENRVLFEPLGQLAPQADTFYKVHVRGTTEGDKRVKVHLMSDEVTEPVTKEESTHVYADQ
jgi:uncharacterized repeat protein (TIGR01451 family)